MEQREPSIFLPYGEIMSPLKDDIEYILSPIKDNRAFILLRDILCCFCNYMNYSVNEIHEYISLFPSLKNISVGDIYSTLLINKELGIDWNSIFKNEIQFSIFTREKYNDRELELSKCPYTNKFNEDVLRAIPYSEDGGMSAETIIYSNMNFLVHSTYFDNSKEEREKMKSIASDGYLKISNREEQFPGVYTTLFTDVGVRKFDERYDRMENVLFIFPLYLLKSRAWHANIIETYGTIYDVTITSHSIIDHIASDNQNLPSFEEIVFHYPLPIQEAIHVVCDESYYSILKPLFKDKLVTFENFEKRRYLDDLFVKNNYDRRELRLDYVPAEAYGAILSIRSLYCILVNSGVSKKNAKILVRTTDRKELMSIMYQQFWKNYKENIKNKAIIHPPW